ARALAGETEPARRLLEELERTARRRYVSSYYFALLHLALGEHDLALARLELAYEERSGFLAFLKVEPLLDPLRDDPRFRQLEKAVTGGG
ncbi:MAG TPA: hypothetical protein VEQ42_09045, partial [Pyrinomonadaceae bacterium]|nr:hypothetical protein [Pyrinomonadaceae bacterium]